MDIVIVGAGLAGLYAAELLIRNGRSVTILERKMWTGGRMQTVYDEQFGTYERGAWRVHGPRAEKLIKRYGSILNDLKSRKNQETVLSDSEVLNMTGLKKSPIQLSASDVFHLAGIPPYIGEKGYHGIGSRAINTRSYSIGETTDIHYRYLVEGWSSIIKNLETSVKSSIVLGAKFMKYDGENVTWQDREGTIISKKVNACLITIPPNEFPVDDIMLKLVAATVDSHALVHLWFEADIQVQHIDFVSNNTPMSQVIANPIQPSNLVQIYACDKDAHFWNRLYQYDKRKCLQVLRKYIKDANLGFKVVKIIDLAFWEHAVHTWSAVRMFPGADKASKMSIVPDPLHRPNMVLCGEAFSTKQGWADGSLETVEQAVDHLLNNRWNSYKPIQRDFILMYNGYNLKIPKYWLNIHPGGKSAITKYINQDISHLWSIYHDQSKLACANLWYTIDRGRVQL